MWPRYSRGMERPILTREQCRQIDRIAIEEYGISGLVLMENAGRGCVDVLERLGIDGPIVVLCGKGNNAGDGFVIARHLDIRGDACRVILLCPPHELRNDAATNFSILQKANVPIIDLSSERAGASSPPPKDDLLNQLTKHATGATWLIDALLGTGATGDPRPPFDTAIDWMNSHPAKKLAVDLPSGLDCDTGQPAAHTVRADHTCTFAVMKIGFTQPSAKSFTGTIHVCDIGVPPQLIDDVLRLRQPTRYNLRT
jgi:NAD(P)H-hydrate epimerase